MIGSVSATVGGKPALFILRDDLIWEVERSPGVPDDALDHPIARLMHVVATWRPGGPCPIVRAADAIGGVPYLPETE